jgi:hypothetical protein
MNTIARRCLTVILLCGLVFPAFAQHGLTRKNPVTYPCTKAYGDRIGYRSGAPFTATWKHVVTARYADGMPISADTTDTIARDSAGKTYFEVSFSTASSSGNLGARSFQIIDPIKPIAFSWSEGSNAPNVVLVSHGSNPDTRDLKQRLDEAPWTEPGCFAWDKVDGQYQGGNFQRENLGTKTILGIEAEGILDTRVLLAGYEGYNETVTVTEERWYSSDLQIELLNIVDDPRVGRDTWELANIVRIEPSPALFRLPSGYSIDEIYPGPSAERSAAITKPPEQ